MFKRIKKFIKKRRKPRKAFTALSEMSERNNKLLENIKTLESEISDLTLGSEVKIQVNDGQKPRNISTTNMKIGYVFNLANNSYIHAKIMRRAGYDAELLIEDADAFPLAQPYWEDLDFECRDLQTIDSAQRLNWSRPEWVKIIQQDVGLANKLMPIGANVQETHEVLKKYLGPQARLSDAISLNAWIAHLPIISAMRNYDVLHVSGLAISYAPYARKPYVILPFGGDLFITAFQNDRQGKLQRKGFEKASTHIVGSPYLFEYMERLGLKNTVRLPFMVDTDKYCPLEKKDNKLRDILREKYQANFIFFVPSRQDWYWKGSDSFLKAYAKVVEKTKDVILLLTHWGDDLKKSKALIEELGIQNRVAFIPILSKKRLIKYLHAADAVIDHFFEGGWYGTSTLEAMACGRPVLIYLDEAKFRERSFFDEMPPVCNAYEPDEIARQMEELIKDPGRCRDIGRASRDWVVKYHGWRNLIDQYIEVYKKAIKDYDQHV